VVRSRLRWGWGNRSSANRKQTGGGARLVRGEPTWNGGKGSATRPPGTPHTQGGGALRPVAGTGSLRGAHTGRLGFPLGNP
jgi:hypothetical protein